MKSIRILLTVVATALAAIALTIPAPSFAANLTNLAPSAVANLTNYGATNGDIASLAVSDQTGTQDTPADYVQLRPGTKLPYRADFTFTLPNDGSIHRYAVQQLTIQANLRVDTARQSWTFLLYNTRTKKWTAVGKTVVITAGTWTPASLILKYNGVLSDFVDPTTRNILVELQAASVKYTASLDFLAVAVTSPDVVAAPTLPGLPSGCTLFPVDNVWNARIDMLPVARNSAAFVAALGKTTGLHPDFDAIGDGIPYNVSDGSQYVNFTTDMFDYGDESDSGHYPITISSLQENGGDGHVLAANSSDCHLYELYDARNNGTTWTAAGSGAIWDLSSNAMRPLGWTSADAAGLPILPGLARYDEVAAGHINHALRFTANRIRDAYIWPASHHATCHATATNPSVPPMGQRFRLKASYQIPDSFDTQTKVVLTALKEYGMILADCGSNWYISGEPSLSWNDDALVNQLRQVPGSQFEAVDESSLQVSADSYQITP